LPGQDESSIFPRVGGLGALSPSPLASLLERSPGIAGLGTRGDRDTEEDPRDVFPPYGVVLSNVCTGKVEGPWFLSWRL
jgi:hypothetical protein